MAQLGTFADEMVCHENSLVRIEPHANMKAAALISCGISTGFGSAVDRAKVKPGETVVVIGCGGVGSGAIQGARIAGARTIIAVDPVPFKLEKAKEVGATHGGRRILDAQFMLPELTQGRNADVVILTPGVLHGRPDRRRLRTRVQGRPHRGDGYRARSSRWTSSSTSSTSPCPTRPCWAPCSVRPARGSRCPNLLNLFEAGQLKIDEIITQEYSLDQVQQGYDDQAAGTIIRGVVAFDA